MKTGPKIITIVGATTSGKTALSIALAKQFSGEIISADSRQVYRGLDLGTGKVIPSEMAGITHHLLDVADPANTYTASDFKRDSEIALQSILARQHLPIIVGGTFMYLDTLLGRISLPAVPPNEPLRRELETLDTATLLARLVALDPARASAIDHGNRRRLIRAIEIAATLGHVPKTSVTDLYQVLSIGLVLPQAELHQRIKERLLARLDAGMLEEVKTLLKRGIPHARLESLGLEYRYCSRHLRGELSYDLMVKELTTKSYQYAKRQLTWLKRDSTIHWFHPQELDAIFSTVNTFLND